MAEVDYKKPALIGGAIVGLLSVMPILQTLSACFCFWAWVGGAVAAKLLINSSSHPITPRDGAKVGLMAGLFGAVIYFVIETPIAIWQIPVMMETAEKIIAEKIIKDPQAAELYRKIAQTQSLRIIFAALFTFIGALFTIVFTVLGGMVGAKLFEKRQNQSPPSQYPSDYPPPPPPTSGNQGGWPQS